MNIFFYFRFFNVDNSIYVYIESSAKKARQNLAVIWVTSTSKMIGSVVYKLYQFLLKLFLSLNSIMLATPCISTYTDQKLQWGVKKVTYRWNTSWQINKRKIDLPQRPVLSCASCESIIFVCRIDSFWKSWKLWPGFFFTQASVFWHLLVTIRDYSVYTCTDCVANMNVGNVHSHVTHRVGLNYAHHKMKLPKRRTLCNAVQRTTATNET